MKLIINSVFIMIFSEICISLNLNNLKKPENFTSIDFSIKENKTMNESMNKENINNDVKIINNEETKIIIISNDSNSMVKIKKSPFSHSEKYTDFIIYENCNKERCPSNIGNCILDNLCKCKTGYMTVISLIYDEKESFCNYQMKHKSYAILLEILFPGLGYYYIGNTGYSYSKIILITVFVLFGIIPRSLKYFDKNEKKSINEENYVMVNLATFYSLNLLDMVYFSLLHNYDGNYVPLQA